MKDIKYSKLLRMIRDGEVEAITDIKYGIVEVRNLNTKKRITYNVIRD